MGYVFSLIPGSYADYIFFPDLNYNNYLCRLKIIFSFSWKMKKKLL